MRIGFDGKRAVQNLTGLGNYSRYIADILCRFYPENEYILYAPKKRDNKRLDALVEKYRQLHLAYPSTFCWKKLSSLWRISGITRQLENEEVGIFHGLSNELPLNIHKSHIKSIVSIHDLIFLRYPQYYHLIDRKIYAYKFRKACENADKIIAISECTKRDIIEFFHIPANKIEVVYQGCDPVFERSAGNEKKEEVRSKYQLPPKYILNVGSIEERKNALLLVHALPQLPQDIHLVIVGRRTPYTEKIERFASEHNLTSRVHIMHNVPFGDLPAIYQLAEIFAYPSYFEGFGIPIIEALHSGIPVVAATGSCLEEAGGPNSIYVNPDSVDEASRAFNEILSKPEKKKLMIEKGKEFIKQFSEEKQAAQIIDIYNNINNRYE